MAICFSDAHGLWQRLLWMPWLTIWNRVLSHSEIVSDNPCELNRSMQHHLVD